MIKGGVLILSGLFWIFCAGIYGASAIVVRQLEPEELPNDSLFLWLSFGGLLLVTFGSAIPHRARIVLHVGKKKVKGVTF